MMWHKPILVACVLLTAPATYAQTAGPQAADAPVRAGVESAENKKLSQLSLETFAKYIQVAYDRNLLTQKTATDGSGSTYVLKGSLFGIGGVLNGNFNEFSTQQGSKFTRHLSIEAGAKTGKGTSLSDGAFGFTYSLINRRDPFFNFASQAVEDSLQVPAHRSFTVALAKVKAQINELGGPSSIAGAKMQKELRAAQDKDLKANAAGTGEPTRDAQIAFFKSLGYEVIPYNYAVVADALKNRGLLTIFGRGATNFGKTQGFNHTEIGARYLVGGITKNRNSLELDAQTLVAWDTTATSKGEQRGLNHRAFITTLGANKVLISSSDIAKPLLEFKLSAGYEHRPDELYHGESRDKLYGETSLRIRINDQVWAPLTVQYDTHGNVLGFLKVVWNIVPN